MAARAGASPLFKGRYAVHPVLTGAANIAATAGIGRISATWAPTAERLLAKWKDLSVCMPKYAEFLSKTSRKDLKKVHVFMNDAAQAKLFEFYLCCALRLRPQAVEEAGQDSEKLLQLGGLVAQEDVEPFFQECREFVAGYDEHVHRQLDETTVWREVDDGLFWHHSFEITARNKYLDFQKTALPPKDSWPDAEDSGAVEVLLQGCQQAVAEGGQASGVAGELYATFLEASSMPVKGAIRAALIDNGVTWGDVGYRGSE
mmetsp:Transcript_41/g.110  ORF Transcript_41/g.110 Transcript_41/m.110 type:complete len:259 (+) Transcript_41:57-833(+)